MRRYRYHRQGQMGGAPAIVLTREDEAMRKSMFVVVMTTVCLLASAALAETETVTYGVSADGENWRTATVMLDSQSWTKTYVDGYPLWIAGSEITTEAAEDMEADASAEGVLTGSICQCHQPAGKMVGYCPCTGSCRYNGTSAICTAILVE